MAQRASRLKSLHLMPLVLLVTVAAIQFYMALNFDLSAWKGGGFGMFSTVDHPGTREIIVFYTDENGKKHKLERRFFNDLRKSFRTLPTRERFNKLVQKVADRVRSQNRIHAKYLIIQYWRYTYNQSKKSLQKQLIYPKRIRLDKK